MHGDSAKFMKNALKQRKNLLLVLACLLALASCNYSEEELKRISFAGDMNGDIIDEEPEKRGMAYFNVGGKYHTELEIDIYNTKAGRETKPEFFINDEKLKQGAREAGFEKMSVETLDKRKYTINLLAPDEPLKIEERE